MEKLEFLVDILYHEIVLVRTERNGHIIEVKEIMAGM